MDILIQNSKNNTNFQRKFSPNESKTLKRNIHNLSTTESGSLYAGVGGGGYLVGLKRFGKNNLCWIR